MYRTPPPARSSCRTWSSHRPCSLDGPFEFPAALPLHDRTPLPDPHRGDSAGQVIRAPFTISHEHNLNAIAVILGLDDAATLALLRAGPRNRHAHSPYSARVSPSLALRAEVVQFALALLDLQFQLGFFADVPRVA